MKALLKSAFNIVAAVVVLFALIHGRTKELPRLVCGVKNITERASTQDARGTGDIVARDYRKREKGLGLTISSVQVITDDILI